MSVYFPPQWIKRSIKLAAEGSKKYRYIYIYRSSTKIVAQQDTFYKQEFTIDRIVYIMEVLCI